MAETTRPRTYEKIQEEQRKILSSYYDKGMTTTGNNMQKTIEEAAAKTNLSIDRVKVMFACVLYERPFLLRKYLTFYALFQIYNRKRSFFSTDIMVIVDILV